MLELLLLRHAKSARDDPGLGDHDRDLAPRGRRAAPLIGRALKERDLVPDLVLCSTARRAGRTWQLAAAELGSAPPVRELKSLYLAPPAKLLEILRRQDRDCRRLMLVGHNPGLQALAIRLAGPGQELDRLRAKFPTGAVVRLGFDLESWADLAPGSGRLLDFLRPRDLD